MLGLEWGQAAQVKTSGDGEGSSMVRLKVVLFQQYFVGRLSCNRLHLQMHLIYVTIDHQVMIFYLMLKHEMYLIYKMIQNLFFFFYFLADFRQALRYPFASPLVLI